MAHEPVAAEADEGLPDQVGLCLHWHIGLHVLRRAAVLILCCAAYCHRVGLTVSVSRYLV